MKKFILIILLLLIPTIAVTGHEGEHITIDPNEPHLPEWCMNSNAGYIETLEDGLLVCHVTATDNELVGTETTTDTKTDPLVNAENVIKDNALNSYTLFALILIILLILAYIFRDNLKNKFS